MSGSLKGLLINVAGVVQGVGFRWFARRVASQFGVNGYVRNLYDDSVEIYVEGEETALKAFLDEVRIGPHSAHVSNVRVNWTEFNGKFKDLRIEV